MHWFLLTVCVISLLWWGELALEWWVFARKRIDLGDLPEPSGEVSLSVIVPARNEARSAERALISLLEALPENGEVIFVNDRSTDETGDIARRFALQDRRLKVLDVTDVPDGWLGKTHAMQAGYAAASGEYLLFTDADVIFKPGCLARGVHFCQTEGVDHLVATPLLVTEGFWERAFVSLFSIILVARFRIWRASIPGSRFFAGIGAFNLVSRAAYQEAGTHKAIKEEVVDDLLLGRLVKKSGGRQQVVSGERCLQVRWNEGLEGLVKGLEKNAYAGLEYSPFRAVLACLALVLITLPPGALPIIYVFFPHGVIGGSIAAAGAGVWFSFAVLYGFASRGTGTTLFYFLTYPLGTVLLVWAILNSMMKYYSHGGIRWRGTVYKRKNREGGKGKVE